MKAAEQTKTQKSKHKAESVWESRARRLTWFEAAKKGI